MAPGGCEAAAKKNLEVMFARARNSGAYKKIRPRRAGAPKRRGSTRLGAVGPAIDKIARAA